MSSSLWKELFSQLRRLSLQFKDLTTLWVECCGCGCGTSCAMFDQLVAYSPPPPPFCIVTFYPQLSPLPLIYLKGYRSLPWLSLYPAAHYKGTHSYASMAAFSQPSNGCPYSSESFYSQCSTTVISPPPPTGFSLGSMPPPHVLSHLSNHTSA